MLKTNTPQSIRERAYVFIRGKILSGEFAPGAALSEASIAREMGNSRGPLREAVRRLTAEGFLRPAPSGGSVVVNFSRRDVAELYELREALEVYAAGKAAERGLRPAELDTMQELVDAVLLLRDEVKTSGEHHLGTVAMRRFIRIDLEFHNTLVRAAANSRILKTVADTRVLLNIFGIRRNGHNVQQLTQIHGYHNQILMAIGRKDPTEAMRLLGEHIRVSKEERLREHDDWEREAALGQYPVDPDAASSVSPEEIPARAEGSKGAGAAVARRRLSRSITSP
jgi:DNA-binding GntR family transcriptional regulator